MNSHNLKYLPWIENNKLSVHTIKPIYEANMTFQTEFDGVNDERATILISKQCTDERVENCKEWDMRNSKDLFTKEYRDIIGQ